MLRKLGLVLAFGVLCAGFFFTGDADNVFAQSTSATPTPSPSQTPPPIIDDEVLKIDTEVVNVLFTAQDRNRRLLTNLTKNDIRLLEDGVPQELSAFTRQVDLPLSLSILIDVSVSQQRTLPEEKDAAISFLESVVRPSKDEVSILSFTGETTLEQDMTNNLTRLRRAVENVKFVPPSGYVGVKEVDVTGQRSEIFNTAIDRIFYTVFDRKPHLAKNLGFRDALSWERTFEQAGFCVTKAERESGPDPFPAAWFVLEKRPGVAPAPAQ